MSGDAVLSHGIARFMAGKAHVTTRKTRVTNRKKTVI